MLVDRYKLGDRLALGGMGTVYEAHDERLDRRVVVKLLKDELAEDPRFVERFRREARSAAALSHPNIATVFDYGEQDGTHFIVMELVQGRDLARVLREEGPLSPDRAVRIATQICEALGHAHAAGVVHRDVKPANVIVGEADRVKVTDFGIARAAGQSTLTATGSMLGTAHYISPEQAEGAKVGPASDIYSLGIVVYEMLTGSVPFTGDSPVAVAMRHVSDEVPPPSTLNPSVPPELDEVVARATATVAADRWRDTNEMAVALRTALMPTTEAPAEVAPTMAVPSVWPIPGTRWDPNKLGRIVVVTMAALALLAATLLLFRLVSDDDGGEGERRGRGGGGVFTSPASSPTPSPSPSPGELGDILGERFQGVQKQLEEFGLVVDVIPVDSEEEKHTIVDVDPDVGTTVFPGDTITLYVSSGQFEEEGDD